MAAFTYFTARLYVEAVVADSLDAGTDPDIKGVHAGVTITPLLLEDGKPARTLAEAVQSGTLAPNPALVAIAPVDARIDNGRLKLRADDQFDFQGNVATYAALPAGLTAVDAGKAWVVDADGLVYVWSGSAFPADGAGESTIDQPDVRLVADTAVLGLSAEQHLGYRVDFDHVTFNAADQTLPAFAFQAPTADSVVDLATVARVPLS